MITTVIFDMDGTLYDETPVKVKAELLTAEYIGKKNGIDIGKIYNVFRNAKEEVKKLYKGMPLANDRNLWYEKTLTNLDVTNINPIELSEYYWNTIFNSMKPYVDLEYIISQLKEKYKLFVLSDELYEIHKRKLKALGLDKVFLKTISAEEIGETKPSSKLFEYAINVVNEEPQKILMVGDNPAADILGGNSVGMYTAWLRRGKYFYYDQSITEKPNIIFTNYIQLSSCIRQCFEGEQYSKKQ